MYHYHHMHRCGRSVSRLFWFIAGGATATWWHVHKDYHGWYEARHCGRDRIPQNAYPAPGTPPPASPPAQMDPNVPANPPVPGTMDKWERWGWGHWGRGSWPGQENANAGANPNDRWGWNFRHGGPGAPARPEGAWGPPMPSPHPQEPEKDVMQQAQETITDLSEATLNNLLVTVESLKAKLAEHRAQREQQERELQALREAKFRQFEEWQRQQLTEDKKGNNDAARRVV